MNSLEEIERLFDHHAPSGAQAQGYQRIREAAKVLAQVIFDVAPLGADRTAAIRKLREAVMTAIAGITCDAMADLGSVDKTES